MFGVYLGSHIWNALSSYAPSFRLKRLAHSHYGFGHTSVREPGDVRGTAIGKKGRRGTLKIIVDLAEGKP